jgi:hypothetical protein
MKISIFTHMTNPEKRNDPWKESLNCYRDFCDELVIVGENWPEEFKWDYIGKVFQEGFEKCSGDWAINMSIDHIFHEDDILRLRKVLEKHSDSPAVAFPQHQIFTPDRYHLQTKLCVAINKNKFPHVIFNGGNDLCLPTLNNMRLLPENMPNSYIPLWNYDKVFGTKESISLDRARFARAWYEQFNSWGVFGGPTPDAAFDAWLKLIKSRYKRHVIKLNIDQHPKYIRDKLNQIDENQFGFDAFGLKNITKSSFSDILRGKRYEFQQLVTKNKI